MEIKRKLKNIKFIYETNAFVKALALKRDTKKINTEYEAKADNLGLIYSNNAVKKLFSSKIQDRKITVANKKLSILWVGASKEQDYSGCIQGLKKFGDVIEYMDKNGKYLLELQNSKFEPELIDRNNKRLLDFIEDIYRSGKSIDILIGQFWANCLSEECLKKIQDKKIITINVSMDDRLPELWRKHKNRYMGVVGLVQGLDLVLTTSPEACIRYLYHGCPVLYWPLGSDPDIFKPAPIKDIDVSFIGNCYGIRRRIVEDLEQKGVRVTTFGNGWGNGPVGPEESAKIFGRSKIILGIGTIGYCNDMFTLKLRDFDATMSGSLYLTHRNPDLENIFKEGYEAEYYESSDEAANKIKHYLDNPELAEEIGKRAYGKAKAEYTWEKRFGIVFSFIKQN